MSEVFSVAQVEALASDGSSLSSARALARTTSWVELGAGADPVPGVWGLCKGSGARPYQTCVDLAGVRSSNPAYVCSCPSRRFPCKHTLALLLVWSAGEVPEAPAPDWVREWHASRADRAAKAAGRTRRAPDEPPTPAQRQAAQRRAEQRTHRVAGGLAELDQWLADQIRGGIAGLDRAGYRYFDQVAARLVDAQAPGVANAVRGLGALVGSGEGWPGRVLAELSLLRLLSVGYRAAGVDERLAETIRARIGFTVGADEILAGPRHRDEWQVIGVRDEIGEELSSRRVWLVGATTGRSALVLSFAAMGQALSGDLVVGTTVEADLCFYPGAPLRALVAQRYGQPGPLREPAPALDVRGVLTRYARALAGNPWLTAWPVIVHGTLLPGQPWRLVDAAGDALPLLPGLAEPWALLAAGGGDAITLAAEWGPSGLRPLAGYRDGQVVTP